MTSRSFAALATPALMILLACARAAYAQAPDPCLISFDLDRADTLGAVGVQSSIATDAAGRPHIAYRNATGSQVRYAHREGTRWVVQVIPQAGISIGVSLALDAAGNPYIGYAAQQQTPFGTVTSARLAQPVARGWAIETIDTGFPTEVSIAFDSSGVLHAAYFTFITGPAIHYATRTVTGWSSETVLTITRGVGVTRFSLVFDLEDRPHITCQTSTTILHAVRNAGGWSVDRQPWGEGSSLAVDAQGLPHVATHVHVPPAVQYRTRQNGAWTVETVDGIDAGPERGVSLKIDRFGRPVLAYFDAAAGRLKVAWKDGGVWRTQMVDEGGSGEGPSLFLAEGANPRISYLDDASYDLRFASGDLTPRNFPPAANAGGPYAGVVGERVVFDGARSSDAGGHALAYAWDFGDGVPGAGRNPEHAYAAAGTYHVCLTVTDDGCPVLADQSCATANVQDALAARVFRRQKGKINLGDDGERHCFQLEPIAGNFKLADLDLPSLVARFDTTQVRVTPGKAMIAADTDHNGVEEVRVCLTAEALRTLLASAPLGKSQVTIRLEGALISGARVRGSITFLIKKKDNSCDGECAEVWPNPLNPDATLTFATSRPGSTEASMFDVHGRLLRTLLARSFLGAGTHEIRIDGRDRQGRPLPSGVYFYRIDTPERTITGRFSIIK